MLRRWHARTGLAALLVVVASVFAATANAGGTSVLTGAPYSPACGVGTSFPRLALPLALGAFVVRTRSKRLTPFWRMTTFQRLPTLF
jgi:hypothetical protein